MEFNSRREGPFCYSCNYMAPQRLTLILTPSGPRSIYCLVEYSEPCRSIVAVATISTQASVSFIDPLKLMPRFSGGLLKKYLCVVFPENQNLRSKTGVLKITNHVFRQTLHEIPYN